MKTFRDVFTLEVCLFGIVNPESMLQNQSFSQFHINTLYHNVDFGERSQEEKYVKTTDMDKCKSLD